MTEIRHLVFDQPLELHFVDGGAETGTISGYGAVFGVQTISGCMVDRGAFSASLAAHKAAGTAPKLLWQHNTDQPIGVWTSFTEDARGLRLTGQLNLQTAQGAEAHALLKQGALDGLSIGVMLQPNDSYFDRNSNLEIITKADLWEVSVVTFPANPDARIAQVHSVESKGQLEQHLRKSGLSRAAARRIASGGWAALDRPQPIDAGDKIELLAAIRTATSDLQGRHIAMSINNTVKAKPAVDPDDPLSDIRQAFQGYNDQVTGLNADIDNLRREMRQTAANAAAAGFVDMVAREDRSKEFSEFHAFLAGKRDFTLSGTTNPDGGYTVGRLIDSAIQDQLIAISPMRSIARVVTVSQGFGEFKLPIGRRGATSSWVAENQTRPATNTPTLGMVTPPSGEIMSYAKATQWLLDDSVFNMEDWLRSNIVDEQAYQEGVAFMTGTGVNQPQGLLSGTPVNTADATRAFGVLKYYPTGNAGAFPASNPSDALIAFVYDLTAPYRANARWLMNSNTAKTIRLFKDSQGLYIWQRALVAGQPDMLGGYPVTIDEGMPDIAANSYSVAFGDFTRGYIIVDRLGTKVLRDPFTTPGWINLYVFRRVGGAIADNNAIRLMKFAAS